MTLIITTNDDVQLSSKNQRSPMRGSRNSGYFFSGHVEPFQFSIENEKVENVENIEDAKVEKFEMPKLSKLKI